MSSREPLVEKYTAAAVRELAQQIEAAGLTVFNNLNDHPPALHALLNQAMDGIEQDSAEQLSQLENGTLTNESAREFLDRYPVHADDIIISTIEQVENGSLKELKAKLEDVKMELGIRGGRNAGKPYEMVLNDEYTLFDSDPNSVTLEEAQAIVSRYQGETKDVAKRVVNEVFPKAAPAKSETSSDSEYEDTQSKDSSASSDSEETASPPTEKKGWVAASGSRSDRAAPMQTSRSRVSAESAPVATINADNLVKPLQELLKTIQKEHPKMKGTIDVVKNIEKDARVLHKVTPEQMQRLETSMKNCPKAAWAYREVDRAMKGEAPAAKTGIFEKIKSAVSAGKSTSAQSSDRGAAFQQAYDTALQQKSSSSREPPNPSKAGPEITMGRK